MVKIDYVFPYVTMNDENWLRKYKEFCPEEKDWTNDESRFREAGTINILIDLILKNLPWINNIFILVTSPSQHVFIKNCPKVRFIYHHQFIPKEFLPTFNSSTIEMFLHNIPELAEHFIYGNDDIFPIQPLSPEEFFNFSNNKIRIGLKEVEYKPTALSHQLVKQANGVLGIDSKEKILVPSHCLTPMLKSTNQAIFNKYHDLIMNSCTKFRDNSKNFNQYLITMYSVKNDLCENINIPQWCGTLYWFKHHSLDEFEKQKMLCINDASRLSTKDFYQIWSEVKLKLYNYAIIDNK